MISNISTKGGTEFKNRIHLPQCQSTNDVLFAILQASDPPVPSGFLVTTDHQLAGRGQRGAVWEAEPGKNLLFSLLLRPQWLPLRHSFWLSAAVASGICKTFLPELPAIKVKWPNDLYVDDQKLGGILIENATSGQFLDRSIVGIGININQTKLPEGACSLASLLKKEKDLEDALNRVMTSIQMEIEFLRTNGWEKMRSKYYLHLYRMAALHTYQLPDGKPFKALLKSISEEGLLVLLTQNGEKRFSFKEVAMVK